MIGSANMATRQHPVIREIKKRSLMMKNGPIIQSSNRLGLVIEGGGMRGVFSGGCLVGMEELGLNEIFDEVYGESGGAMNAAYFLAKQAALGITIYTDNLSNTRFVNLLRLNSILNIDFLVDEIITRLKSLDTKKIRESRSSFFISVTKATDGSKRVIDAKATPIPLLKVLKATTAIIPLYNQAVELDDGLYVDGGISNPIPICDAVAHGCNLILVLLTRPDGFCAKKIHGVLRFIIEIALRKWDQRLREAFFNYRYKAYNYERDIAFGRVLCAQPVDIAVICPDDYMNITRITKKRSIIYSAILHGEQKALEILC